jgi:hypothetical protein
MEDLEKYPFKSCRRCYYKINRPICKDVMGVVCVDWRPAKVTRAKREPCGGA